MTIQFAFALTVKENILMNGYKKSADMMPALFVRRFTFMFYCFTT